MRDILPDNTQHSQGRNIYAPGETQTRNPSKRAVADPCLQQRRHRDRQYLGLITAIMHINPLNPELNPIRYLLALLGAPHFLHVSRIRVKLLTFRLLMSHIYIYIYIYIYGAPILDVSR